MPSPEFRLCNDKCRDLRPADQFNWSPPRWDGDDGFSLYCKSCENAWSEDHVRKVQNARPDSKIGDWPKLDLPEDLRISSFVYFIQAGDSGPIKIGIAGDPRHRMKSLQTGNPSELRLLLAIQGSMSDEQEFHYRFVSDRIRGEWFHPSSLLVATIKELKLKNQTELGSRPVSYVAASGHIHQLAMLDA